MPASSPEERAREGNCGRLGWDDDAKDDLQHGTAQITKQKSIGDLVGWGEVLSKSPHDMGMA